MFKGILACGDFSLCGFLCMGDFVLKALIMHMYVVCCVISSQTLGISRSKIIIIFISLVLLPPPPLHFLLFHYLVHWNIETLYFYYRFIHGHSAFTKNNLMGNILVVVGSFGKLSLTRSNEIMIRQKCTTTLSQGHPTR